MDHAWGRGGRGGTPPMAARLHVASRRVHVSSRHVHLEAARHGTARCNVVFLHSAPPDVLQRVTASRAAEIVAEVCSCRDAEPRVAVS